MLGKRETLDAYCVGGTIGTSGESDCVGKSYINAYLTDHLMSEVKSVDRDTTCLIRIEEV